MIISSTLYFSRLSLIPDFRMLRRNCERIFGAPSSPESRAQSIPTYSGFLAPLSDIECLSVKSKNSIPARIVHLNGLGYPSAIFLAVVSVIINAVKREPRPIPISHFFHEYAWVTPSWIVRYSAPSIVFVLRIIFVPASSLDVFNDLPNRLLDSTNACSMSKESLSAKFAESFLTFWCVVWFLHALVFVDSLVTKCNQN